MAYSTGESLWSVESILADRDSQPRLWAVQERTCGLLVGDSRSCILKIGSWLWTCQWLGLRPRPTRDEADAALGAPASSFPGFRVAHTELLIKYVVFRDCRLVSVYISVYLSCVYTVRVVTRVWCRVCNCKTSRHSLNIH
jgi:hypothetical protein